MQAGVAGRIERLPWAGYAGLVRSTLKVESPQGLDDAVPHDTPVRVAGRIERQDDILAGLIRPSGISRYPECLTLPRTRLTACRSSSSYAQQEPNGCI